jgi:hypothetical protein
MKSLKPTSLKCFSFSIEDKGMVMWWTPEEGLLPRGQRQRQGEWLKEHKEVISLYSAGTAIVMTSSVLRFVLATIYLIQPPFVPTEIFATMEQATAWVDECLKGLH